MITETQSLTGNWNEARGGRAGLPSRGVIAIGPVAIGPVDPRLGGALAVGPHAGPTYYLM